MSLSERLAKPPVDPFKQYCTVGKLLDALYDGPAADADERRVQVLQQMLPRRAEPQEKAGPAGQGGRVLAVEESSRSRE